MPNPLLPVYASDQLPTLFQVLNATSAAGALAGWQMLDGPTLGVAGLSNGIYVNQNASALVAAAEFNGRRTLLLSFQQSNDAKDFETDFRNINAHYTLYSPLLQKVRLAISSGLYDQVLVTGWSLGGAMTQLFIDEYNGIAPVFGLTVGSPGYLQAAAQTDSRIINYLDGQDLFVVTAAQRAQTKFLPTVQINALSQGLGLALGIPADLFSSSVPFMTANYYQTGTSIILNGPLASPLTLLSKLQMGDYGPLLAHLLSSYQTAMQSVNQNPHNFSIGSAATSGADHVFGTSSSDTLQGLGGNDVLYGRAGMDTLDGGLGIDTASYVEKSVSVFVSLAGTLAGQAWVNGTLEDTLVGIENLTGGEAGDRLWGDEKGNRLTGGAGNDTLNGEAGADYLVGGDGADQIIGGTGADKLFGQNGIDFLRGGEGIDTLSGGLGADRFVIDVAPGAANADSIADFSAGVDRILLKRAMFAALKPLALGSLLPANQFSGTGLAVDVNDFIIFDPGTGQLSYDPDGSGSLAPLKFATLTLVGLNTLSASDIQIVA